MDKQQYQQVPHVCSWEYLTCKDGETFYTCNYPGCTEIKIDVHDAGCGG